MFLSDPGYDGCNWIGLPKIEGTANTRWWNNTVWRGAGHYMSPWWHLSNFPSQRRRPAEQDETFKERYWFRTESKHKKHLKKYLINRHAGARACLHASKGSTFKFCRTVQSFLRSTLQIDTQLKSSFYTIINVLVCCGHLLIMQRGETMK